MNHNLCKNKTAPFVDSWPIAFLMPIFFSTVNQNRGQTIIHATGNFSTQFTNFQLVSSLAVLEYASSAPTLGSGAALVIQILSKQRENLLRKRSPRPDIEPRLSSEPSVRRACIQIMREFGRKGCKGEMMQLCYNFKE